MPTCHMYLVVTPDDPKDKIDALEAKANALGLGPLKVSKDVLRIIRKPLRRRHYGYKLYLEARPGDTIVFPEFRRAFAGISDCSHNLKRWVTAGVRVIVIDLGLDTSSEFGRNWTAVFLAMMNANTHAIRERNAGLTKRSMAKGGIRGVLGVVRKGPKGGRYFVVEPTLYELGMKCQEFVAQGWSYDDIETHLWKNKIFRVLKFAPTALAVEALRDPLLARKWSATAIRTLVRNVERINQGVLSGIYRLPRTWRPTAGPLKDIPYKQPVHRARAATEPAPESYWDEALAIGRRVRELRREKGWTQPQLGQRCGGVGQPQIADLERGMHRPRPAFLAKVAKALGVPVETFDLKPAVPV